MIVQITEGALAALALLALAGLGRFFYSGGASMARDGKKQGAAWAVGISLCIALVLSVAAYSEERFATFTTTLLFVGGSLLFGVWQSAPPEK